MQTTSENNTILYRFLDWILRLPEDLKLQYTDAIFAMEESLKMPYVSYVERRGKARGAGLLLRGLLEERFGPSLRKRSNWRRPMPTA